MREEYEAGGTSQLKLAARHGVDKTSILSILRGRSYRDVGGPLAPPASSSTALDEATIAKLEKYEMAVALGLIED